MGKMIDMTGKKCGRLTILKRGYKTNDTRAYWECLCECGNTSIVLGRYLRSGHTKSCGCLRIERIKVTNTIHNGCTRKNRERLYNIHESIKQRCTNKNTDNYERYGGRGITMCREWDDYGTFREWAYNSGYSKELSIDRIDNSGNYQPNNCRWADDITQANNTRTNIYVVIGDKRKTIAEWSRELDSNAKRAYARVVRGWDLDEKLFY